MIPESTRVGRFLRRTSLDELPQLFNVIGGSLSLVGPRPLTQSEHERYGDDWDRLHTVPPGMTGYWQVNGRSHLTYDDRIRMDMAYIQDSSFTLDCEILARTVGAVLDHHRTG